jgi:hypothetical protein
MLLLINVILFQLRKRWAVIVLIVVGSIVLLLNILLLGSK